MVAAQIDPADIERLRKTIERGAKELNAMTVDLIRQAAIFAIQSAARETGPGNSSTVKKMAAQYKYRKIIPYTGSDFRYQYRTQGGKEGVIRLSRQISRATAAKKGLRQLKKNIEIWDRKLRVTRMVPYTGTASGKYDKTSRVGRIPHYGAAKIGWLKALGRLPGSKPQREDGEEWIPSPKIETVKTKDIYELTIENLVKYVSIISPNAAAVAMRKTANRMEKIIEIKIKAAEKRMGIV